MDDDDHHRTEVPRLLVGLAIFLVFTLTTVTPVMAYRDSPNLLMRLLWTDAQKVTVSQMASALYDLVPRR
jgi:hypothetical protein